MYCCCTCRPHCSVSCLWLESYNCTPTATVAVLAVDLNPIQDMQSKPSIHCLSANLRIGPRTAVLPAGLLVQSVWCQPTRTSRRDAVQGQCERLVRQTTARMIETNAELLHLNNQHQEGSPRLVQFQSFESGLRRHGFDQRTDYSEPASSAWRAWPFRRCSPWPSAACT